VKQGCKQQQQGKRGGRFPQEAGKACANVFRLTCGVFKLGNISVALRCTTCQAIMEFDRCAGN